MKLFWWIILLLSLDSWSKGNSSMSEIKQLKYLSVFKILSSNSETVINDLYKLWNLLLKDPNADISNALFSNKEEEMFQQLLTISSKITELENNVKDTYDITVTKMFHVLPEIVKLELKMNELKLIINQINFADEQMQNYLQSGYTEIKLKGQNTRSSVVPDNSTSLTDNNNVEVSILKTVNSENTVLRFADDDFKAEKYTLDSFATWATDHGFNSLKSLLRRMHDLTAPKNDDGIFNLILQISEFQDGGLNTCNLKQSIHQILYNLYNSIAIAELKGNTILQFSYMILQMYDKGKFVNEAKSSLEYYEKYAKEKIEVAQKALSVADRTIYRCDPLQFVEGVTYTKLTRLLQGYIENEVNLNPYGTCRENCQYYTYTEYNGCFKQQFCAHQRSCKGKVVNCRYVDSDMNICTSTNPERRYDWVEYENGKILGNKGVCGKNLFKVDSWWRYLFWHCSYCLCLCDDVSKESDRYFNLRDVTSDVKENKVVTGLRIVKQNQIIHLQIQQGVLSPYGLINSTTLTWKPVDNYTVDDDNVENNVDYYTMNWLERSIDIDDVFGPSEHVVTGVRFRKIGTHLNLEVRVTPINFTSGEVYKAEHSYWLGNDNTDVNQNKPRTEIDLMEPDIPIRRGPHTLISKPDQYIQFQQSSFDNDAGQNTVPYFDSQALTSQGFPISGVGLIHRGKRGSGGFVAPKLISYDYSPHLRLNKTN